jgi:uncharacterized protein (DUF58 family)
MSEHVTRTQNRLDSLEPHGSVIQLDELLRWHLAASQLPIGNHRSSLLAGGRRSVLRGRGIDFDEVRLYQAGDDVRTIDWRVTARANKPHTKMFREEKERPVLLVIDMRSTMFFGSRNTFKSVMAAHCAALLAWATLEAGDRIGALIISDDGITDIKPRRSRHALLQIFRKLLSVQDSHSQNPLSQTAASTSALVIPTLTTAMHQLRAVSKPGSCLVLLSDFNDWEEACVQALFPVVRHSQVFALRITDVLDHQIPDIGAVRFRFAQWLMPIDTAAVDLRQRYAAQQKTLREQWLTDWRRLRSTSTEISTTDSVLSTLRSLFAHSHKKIASSTPAVTGYKEALHGL